MLYLMCVSLKELKYVWRAEVKTPRRRANGNFGHESFTDPLPPVGLRFRSVLEAGARREGLSLPFGYGDPEMKAQLIATSESK